MPRKKLEEFEVRLRVMVPAYCTKTVKATSQEKAEAKIREQIDRNGWGTTVWQEKDTWEPAWEECEKLEVDS